MTLFSPTGAARSFSLPCPVRPDPWRDLDLQPQTFQWTPQSTHLAAWIGGALVVLSAADCSIAASLPALSLSGLPALGSTFVQCSWLPGPGSARIVAYAGQARQVTLYTLASRQLRSESTPVFVRAPVWGALGCAAWLVDCPGCSECSGRNRYCIMAKVHIWLPWSCVPRPSGVCSGGQIVHTSNHVKITGALAWSPDGTLLAVGATGIKGTGTQDMRVDLLDWRTGCRLKLCGLTMPLRDLQMPVSRANAQATVDLYTSIKESMQIMSVTRDEYTVVATETHLIWSTSGTAIHLGVTLRLVKDDLHWVLGNCVIRLP